MKKDSYSIREDIKELYLDNKDLFFGKVSIRDVCGNFVEKNYGERKFYVYEWFTIDDNKVFYVGKGTGTRYNHIITSDMKRSKGALYKELQEKKE